MAVASPMIVLPPTMIAYKVLEATNYLQLNTIVNEHIKNGYQPLDGHKCIYSDASVIYSQTMIKYDNPR